MSSTTKTHVIGLPLYRYEGRVKVTGRANYAADNRADRTAHAYGVFSPVAAGEIVRVDARAAERAPGVLKVLHHGNTPKLKRVPEDWDHDVKVAEERAPLSDTKIYYAGQFVALVVAETFEQARWAAHLVHVDYRARPHALTLDEGIAAHGAKPQPDEVSQRGDFKVAFEKAAVTHDATYLTPVEVHNAMELHATLARWQDGHLTLHDSTQWVVGQAQSLARVLGIPAEKVTVHAPYIGGGFGGKLFLWPHCTLAAVAARELERPVKLVLPRQLEFTTAGHRPVTRQRVRLGATRDGQLTAIGHDSQTHTSLVTDYVESCGWSTPSLYRCPNVSVTQDLVQVNVGTPTSMRAPGTCSGLWALESALDELALKLSLDPLALRLKNVPPNDGAGDKPWSSCHFGDCLKLAAERFGWSRRQPAVGAMRDSRDVLGWGLAAATWPAHRGKATVRTELLDDGTARVSCATQDIGTGTYTVFAQVVSELTSLPFNKIDVVIGRSVLPRGPISGGSMVTSTVVPAIAEATRRAIRDLFQLAVKPHSPLAGVDVKSLALRDGAIVAGERRATIAEVLRAARFGSAAGEATTGPGEDARKYAMRAFGAHCVEVRWDPGISRLRVSRVVSVFDAGRIINAKTARNQIEGAIVMGLGMALMEESVYDARTGRVANDNLADYHLLTHADTPVMDITFLDRPDPHIGDFGAKGLGEIGITGVAAATANAVHHATGKRIRDLPLTIEKLLNH
jgi:xanthine dehydrogenase YagR molybdenum-binding subunit